MFFSGVWVLACFDLYWLVFKNAVAGFVPNHLICISVLCMFTVGLSLTNYEKTSRANDSELAQNSKNGRMAMMRLIVEEVGQGLHPSEAVVAVKTADGVQRLVVSSRSIQKGTISVGWPLGEKEDAILVELPRETQSGAWRVWVPKNQLIEEERMRA